VNEKRQAHRVHVKPARYLRSEFEGSGQGEEAVLDCDLVISNADMANTYGKLVDSKSRRFYSNAKIDRYDQSMSVVVIYFGVKKQFPELHHHNIILSERYRELIGDIFQRKILSEDFSLYLHIPTRTDSTLAPEGCEACYALVPVPNLESGTDWEKIREKFADKVLKFLDENYMPGLRENIVVKHMIDPMHFRDTLLSAKGNAFGVEPTLMQSAYFRPHNRSQDIKNLYLVGANTQPGAGLPGVLLSAQITDKLIAKDFDL
jgi:phytoene desaturase